MAKNTFLYALMTSLGLLEFIFLEIKPRLLITLKSFVIKFKMKKVLISRKYVALGVIMGRNLKMQNLVSFVMV